MVASVVIVAQIFVKAFSGVSGTVIVLQHQFPTFLDGSPVKNSRIQSVMRNFATFCDTKTAAVFFRV